MQKIHIQKPEPKPTDLRKNCSYDRTPMWYTMQHRTVLIIFPLIFQTILTAQMLSSGGQWKQYYVEKMAKPHTYLLLKYRDKMFQQDVVEVFTTEQCVTIGRFHLKHALLNFQDRYVECSSSEIIHSNATAIPMQQN